MNKWTIVFLMILQVFAGAGQQLLLDKNVDKQNKRNLDRSGHGPNKRHFWSRNIAYGVILPVSASDSLHVNENLSSNWLCIGQRYKFKLSEMFSLGAGLQYARSAWHINQDAKGNLLSPQVKHHSQRLITNELGVGGFVRFNYNRRGNAIGRYIDLGCDGQYTFANRLAIADNVEASLHKGAGKIRTSFAKLDYIVPFQTYCTLRIGFGRFALFGRYRLSTLFRSSDNINRGRTLPDLSPITVGIELTTFRTAEDSSNNNKDQ